MDPLPTKEIRRLIPEPQLRVGLVLVLGLGLTIKIISRLLIRNLVGPSIEMKYKHGHIHGLGLEDGAGWFKVSETFEKIQRDIRDQVRLGT